MNPKLIKVISDIEKTKAKIAELQAVLPELEERKVELENGEFIKLVRSANVSLDELSAFTQACKAGVTPASTSKQGPLSASIQGKEVADGEK